MMQRAIDGLLISDESTTKVKKYDLPVSNTIYTFDMEATSLFLINGEWREFDYSLPPKFYRECEKAAVPYIWMLGIEDNTYYGRELSEFEDVLKEISSPDMLKIFYIHNLSYEMGWLMNIFYDKYTIVDMVARDLKKPIEFRVKELNLIFRCSYMLTNLSLDSAAKAYTSVKKLSGTVDYNQRFSPLCELSDQEMAYCEMDIVTLRELIKYFRKEYKSLVRIPLTATSIIRRALQKKCGYSYIKQQQWLVPNAEMYLRLYKAFSGGFTHANLLFTKRYLNFEVESQDEASEYPSVLCTERFPSKPFIRCSPSQYKNIKMRASCAFLLVVEFDHVKSRYFNHYMQASKCDDLVNPVYDNGRIESCDHCVMTLTDVDYEIILRNYDCKSKIKECYRAKKDYLDPKVIRFILDLYQKKTECKDVPEMEEMYKRVYKPYINGIFGMSCTNPIKQTSDFTDLWCSKEFNLKFVNSKLDEMRDSYSTLFFYAVGVYCCAYARRNLMSIVLTEEMDRDVIYCDTDSCKFRNREKHQAIFMDFNRAMIDKYAAVCERYPDQFTIKDFMPSDIYGRLHPLGMFEFDGIYSELCVYGAKKYCYREDGELHITVAGVSKKGVTALEDNIRNFKKGFTWGYEASGKLAHMYHEMRYRKYYEKDENDELIRKLKREDDLQKPFEYIDRDGNLYRCEYGWSVVLMPTTYTLGLTEDYESIIEEYRRYYYG